MWPVLVARGGKGRRMPDASVVLIGLMADTAVKFAALVFVADLLTRGLTRASSAIAHRLWLVMLTVGALLPVLAWLTPATVLLAPSAVVVNRVPAAMRSSSVSLLIGVVVLSGALFFLLRLVTGMVAIRRLIESSSEVSRAEGNELRHMSRMQTVRGRGCRFASNPALSVPVTVGHWRPWVLLPSDWRSWPASRLAAVMAHEGAHIDRGDYVSGIAATMVRALWWWHPGAWICVARLHLAAEIACDARASGDDGRADYAGHLLDLAHTAGGRRVRYGWTLGATSRLRERIDALLDDGASAQRIGIALRIALVMAAIVATCAAAPIRFTLSRTTDIAPGVVFPHDGPHDAVHGLRHGGH